MKIFVSAGEVSGDIILGKILEQYRRLYPSTFSAWELRGLGGERTMAFGLRSLFSMQELAVNGIGDVLSRAFFLWKLYRQTLKAMYVFEPDLVILVDYPGLNLRLAKKARDKKIKVLYIAPPQTWAYRNQERKNNRMAIALRGCAVHVLFPFEVTPFQGVAKAISVGHFYVTVTDRLPRPKAFPTLPILGLFPGSRLTVLKRNLPTWIKRLRELGYLDSMQVQIVVPGHLESAVTLLLPQPSDAQRKAHHNKAHHQEHRLQKIRIRTDVEMAMAEANYAIAFPGSVTMELAIHRIPTLVLAVVDDLTLWVGGRILAFPQWLSLPNLLLKRRIFPEWFGSVMSLTKSKFGELVAELLGDSIPFHSSWDLVQEDLQSTMGAGDGVEKVCQVIKKELAI